VKDDFSNLDSELFDLASQRGRKSYAPAPKRDTGTAEVVSGRTEGTSGFSIPPAGRDGTAPQYRTARYSGASFGRPRKAEAAPTESHTLREYAVNGEFIKKVTVKSWPTGYGFYEKFVRDAVISHGKRGKKSPHVPFFSYIPQYSQLSAAQWEYYLYVKECAREGSCLPEADFSYVILYVYELINLECVISPTEGAELLGKVWMLYRKVHPMLDKYMSEWMADYCLIHAIPLPKVLLSALADLARGSTVKELYAESIVKRVPAQSGKLLRAALSDYDASRSRYASKLENFVSLTEEVFDSAAGEQLRERSGVFAEKLRRRMTVTRDAFCGSLCASSVKKKIILELDTPFRAPEVRRVVTEMMKGAENVVRARLGVKARLAAPALEGKSAAVSAKSSEELAYLSYYDAPGEALSKDSAAAIEEASWQNTELLAPEGLEDESCADTVDNEVEGAVSGGDGPDRADALEIAEAAEDASGAHTFRDALGEKLYGLLRIAADGKSFSEACRNAGVFADEGARLINECAMDFIGDVVLERGTADYEFIEDYKEDIE